MQVLNFAELLRNMNLATRSLIARVGIALKDVQLVVLPAKDENQNVLPNQFLFMEYSDNGYIESSRIAAEFEKQLQICKSYGGFDFSQSVGYRNGVVMPFELLKQQTPINDTETQKESELDGKESTDEPIAEQVESEKPTRKPKSKK